MLKKIIKIFEFLVKTILVLVGIFFFYVVFFKKEWLTFAFSFLTEKAEVLGNWNLLIAFFFAFCESIPIVGTIMPGQNAVIIIGFVLANKLIFIMIAAGAGAILGDFTSFWMGKKFGKAFFHKYGDAVGIGETEMMYLERQLEKNGFWFLVLGKFNNFVHNYMAFVAGTMQMENRKFWIFNIIGSLSWVIVIILLGAFFHNNYEMILNNLSKIIIVLIMLILGYIAIFKREEFKQYMAEKEKEIERKTNLKKQKNG